MIVWLYVAAGSTALLDIGATFWPQLLEGWGLVHFPALQFLSILALGVMAVLHFNSRQEAKTAFTLSKQALEEQPTVASVFQKLPCAAVVISPEYRLLNVNKEVTELTGWKREEMIGRVCYEFFGTGEVCSNCPVKETYRTHRVHQNLKCERTRGNKEIYIEQTAIPIFNPNGTLEHVMEVVFDVTDRIRLEQENSNLFLQVVDALTHLIERRDVSTGHHSDRVRELAVEIGRELGLETDEVEEISMAGMLHDIGKIGIPEYILNKPGRLTPEEYEIIKQHPQIGYDAIKNIKPLAKIAQAVLYHHEKYNGTGYPSGKAGEEIPFTARILAVADVWEAITDNRIYRAAMTQERAVTVMEEGRGTHFDPEVLEAFFRVLAQKGMKGIPKGKPII